MKGDNGLYIFLSGLTFAGVGLILVLLNPYRFFVIIGITSGYNCGDLSKVVFILGVVILIIGAIILMISAHDIF